MLVLCQHPSYRKKILTTRKLFFTFLVEIWVDKIGVAQEMLKIFLRDDGVKKNAFFFRILFWNILFFIASCSRHSHP